MASAVTEIAAMGGWLPQARHRSRGLLEQGFSSEDLMVLSHGPGSQQPPQPAGLDRDDVLAEYAELLAGTADLTSSDGKTSREGWELAVSVLSRLDDVTRGQRGISDMLDKIEFIDQARVDKVLGACAGLDLSEQARTIAEVLPSPHQRSSRYANMCPSAMRIQCWPIKPTARRFSTMPAHTLP